MKTNTDIHIIGAGISGLIAAIQLERSGLKPTIWESADRVGGRLRTERIEGIPLDIGFQVLLEAYPKAKEYLDYSKLKLKEFEPGAIIHFNGKTQKIGDPLRNLNFLVPAIFSSVGNISDKFNVFKLNTSLSKKPIEDIFNEQEMPTIDYLKAKGFSDKIISNFFQPFFGGIFLENELETSSRMFEFVYKMFGQGSALVPQEGIEEIAKQLRNELQETKIHFNRKVSSVEKGQIQFNDGTTQSADYIIVATDPSGLFAGVKEQSKSWRSCKNLYFKVNKLVKREPLIHLVSGENSIVNNFHYLFLEDDFDVISATVINKNYINDVNLLEKVKAELATVTLSENLEFIKEFHIRKALPIIENVRYEKDSSEMKLSDGIYCIGDYTLNASLNAAMSSGDTVANAIIKELA